MNSERAFAQAHALLESRRVEQAVAAFYEAERCGAPPDACAGGRWNCFMLLGDYAAAWRESDAIRALGLPDSARVWDGTPLCDCRVMVRSVHGLGDAVQMLRYMPLLRQEAARVTLQVAPELVELASCAEGVDQVVAWEQETPFEKQLEITELPYIFRSEQNTVPRAVPYLQLPLLVLERISAGMGQRKQPRVGLVWAGSSWDPTRSLPFAMVEQLLRSHCNLEFWSLQTARDNSEWREHCAASGRLARCGGESTLLSLAAHIACMDLVITIDTLAAHLAGALGTPTWILLKQQADWRWMLERDDSPWYPTARLFRQRAEGEWAPVVAAIIAALDCWHGH